MDKINMDLELLKNIISVTYIGVGTNKDLTNMLYRLVINEYKRNKQIVEDSTFVNEIFKSRKEI